VKVEACNIVKNICAQLWEEKNLSEKSETPPSMKNQFEFLASNN
jgi:hypothetical protein